MQINNTVLITGASHLTTSVSGGFKFNSPEGKQFFSFKQRRYEDAIKYNAEVQYLAYLEEELSEVNSDLTFLLEDEDAMKVYNMSDRDAEGWQLYHSLLDKHTIIKHFIRKLK